MIISIQGKDTEVGYIRIFRDARNAAFYALVGDTWHYFYKLGNKRLPTFKDVTWPNPQHMYGWSEPYQLRG